MHDCVAAYGLPIGIPQLIAEALHASPDAQTDIHQADRFFLRASVRPGDAGDGNADILPLTS